MELLGLLLANPDLVPEAAGKMDVEELRDCAERQVLGRLLRQGAGKGKLDVARFVSSLGEPELASAAARAMAEEQAGRTASRWLTPGRASNNTCATWNVSKRP